MKLIRHNTEYYLLEDGKIDEGDWMFIIDDENKIYIEKCPIFLGIHYIRKEKIIGTTDTSLKLPLLDKTLIETMLSVTEKDKKLQVARNVLSSDTRFSEKDLDSVMFGYELSLRDSDKKFTLEQIVGFSEWLSVAQWRDGVKILYIKNNWEKLFKIYLKTQEKSEWEIEIEIETESVVMGGVVQVGDFGGKGPQPYNYSQPKIENGYITIKKIKN